MTRFGGRPTGGLPLKVGIWRRLGGINAIFLTRPKGGLRGTLYGVDSDVGRVSFAILTGWLTE
jgi:hypothetical protein